MIWSNGEGGQMQIVVHFLGCTTRSIELNNVFTKHAGTALLQKKYRITV